MNHRPLASRPLPLLLVATLAAPVAAGDWPQWRGPDRTGVSNESGWRAEGKEKALWQTNVGLGYSSVVVADGRLVTMGWDEDTGMDVVRCLDPTTGAELWAHAYPAEKWNKFHGGGTNSTPTIAGDRVYVLNREGKFFVLDAATGEVEHEADLKADLDLELPTWGFAASPVVLADLVVLNVGRVLALDRKSLDTVWDTEDLGHAYSTPMPFTRDGAERLAVVDGKGLFVLDAGTGDQVLHREWKTQYDINAATPVLVDGRVFVSSGYEHGCALIDLGTGEIVWESKVMKNKMSGSVLYDGHLYGFDDSIFKCVDLEGNEVWRQRGLGEGAFMVADGKLILVSADGELIVAEASPDGFEELSKADVLDGGVYWSTPVLADGLIYVRNSLGALVCRDHRAGA